MTKNFKMTQKCLKFIRTCLNNSSSISLKINTTNQNNEIKQLTLIMFVTNDHNFRMKISDIAVSRFLIKILA